MSYLVLARKYRPRSFDTLIGQDHVVRALTHALSTQRLHHAWLFTGTRGVGKTTLARILAKSLNCTTGITATPCGQCRACTEIDAGRFVDYVELDAASNRSVDDMSQLLEQAVYAPSAARFKVYMIDEVHMLTGHAFNAMLKTLEEPPPHVKFILATTDPQKIPVTVLSRCLQFNLKQMTGEAIVAHLRQVLGEESIPFEDTALRLIAQGAAGSMRDALSLTDQAIAYSANNLTADAVQAMLGTVDQRHLLDVLHALARGDAAGVIAVADDLAARGLSYAGALADLAVLLARIAIAQKLGHVVPTDEPLADELLTLGQTLQPDQVQLFYTIAVHSRQELALAPDAYAGFVMACLRMLALGGEANVQTQAVPAQTPPAPPSLPPADAGRTAVPRARAALAPVPPAPEEPAPEPSTPDPAPPDDVPAWEDATEPGADSPRPPAAESARERVTAAAAPHTLKREQWPALAAQLPVTGIAAELARQSEWVGADARAITLRVAVHSLARGKARLRAVLSEHFSVAVDLRIEEGDTGDDTAHAVAQAAAAQRQREAEQAAHQDPFVQTLIRDFGARIVPGSIQPAPAH